MRPRTVVLALVFSAFAVFCGEAHPHVFISNRMVVAFDGARLSGITFFWTFDEMFSSMIFTDFAPGADGRFAPGLVDGIKTNDFDNLENYHYFLAFFIGKRPLTKIRIEKFLPFVTNGTRLVYSFFVPLGLPVSDTPQALRVTVYDDSYYVAFDPMRTADVQREGDAAVAVKLSVEKTKVMPLWPGQYMPDQLVIRYGRKP